jgi:hypothetical protein
LKCFKRLEDSRQFSEYVEMDSEKYQRYQVAFPEAPHTVQTVPVTVASRQLPPQPLVPVSPAVNDLPAMLEGVSSEQLLSYIHSGQVWTVNGRQRNGVILFKPFHTEFAGPGAAIGGHLDQDCQRVIPMGHLSLVRPTSHQERQNAYLIRRQWIKLTQQVTDKSIPMQRAQLILNQFETYFDQETIARIPDEAFALMVGVLPYTIRTARRTPGKLTVKVKG